MYLWSVLTNILGFKLSFQKWSAKAGCGLLEAGSLSYSWL